MNQNELLNWFKKEYKLDKDRFFKVDEIFNLFPLEQTKQNLYVKIRKLYLGGNLDNKLFLVKDCYPCVKYRFKERK